MPTDLAGSQSAGNLASPMLSLTSREFIRLSRQPARVLGILGMVGLLWLFLGSGLAGSFTGVFGESYTGFLVAGMATMAVVFSSIFAAISLIEDRDSGLLRAALVSPAPLSAIIGSKLLAGSIVSLAQGGLVLVVGVAILGAPSGVGLLACAAGMLACAIGISGVSIALAWRTRSVAGFHSVMNLILMPMWLLSGAVFPVESAGRWLSWLAMANPLTPATSLVRKGMLDPGAIGWYDTLGAIGFVGIGIGVAWAGASGGRSGRNAG